MEESFINHSEIKWRAEPTGGFYSGAQKLLTTPNIDKFRLKEFVSLKSTVENGPLLKLIGENNQTVIYISCPEGIIQRLAEKLSSCSGKGLAEIIKIKL